MRSDSCLPLSVHVPLYAYVCVLTYTHVDTRAHTMPLPAPAQQHRHMHYNIHTCIHINTHIQVRNKGILTVHVASRGGLNATYHRNGVLGTGVLTRIDPSIDLSPSGRGELVSSVPTNAGNYAYAVPGDMFSARWSGYIRATQAAEYTFRVLTSPNRGIPGGLVPGNYIRVGSEVMRITHVLANSIGHYTPATVTVARGALESVASAHEVGEDAVYVLPIRDLPLATGYTAAGGSASAFGLQGALPLDGYFKGYKIRVDADGVAATAGDVGASVVTAYTAARLVTLQTALGAAPTALSTYEVCMHACLSVWMSVCLCYSRVRLFCVVYMYMLECNRTCACKFDAHS